MGMDLFGIHESTSPHFPSLSYTEIKQVEGDPFNNFYIAKKH
jgi:hypothetical protein